MEEKKVSKIVQDAVVKAIHAGEDVVTAVGNVTKEIISTVKAEDLNNKEKAQKLAKEALEGAKEGFKGKILIKDSDNNILATITRKSLSMRHIHFLIDPTGNLIAKYKKKMVSNFRSIFYLEDPEGTRKYEAYGEFMDFKFNVKDITTEKIIAEFDKVERWKNEISSEILNQYDAYALKIKDSIIDKRMLIGFVLGSKYIIYDVF